MRVTGDREVGGTWRLPGLTPVPSRPSALVGLGTSVTGEGLVGGCWMAVLVPGMYVVTGISPNYPGNGQGGGFCPLGLSAPNRALYWLSYTLKWSARQVTLLLDPAPKAGASLLGYALIGQRAIVTAMQADHKCRKCEKSEPEVQFNLRTMNGRKYKRHLCTKCFNRYNRSFESKKTRLECSRRYAAKIKQWKRSDALTERWILQDSRRSDKRNGRINDLTKEFIKNLIKDGCAYCGETKLRMTLDRVDNGLGHLQTNVKPACVRCNDLRGNMPFAAWLIVSTAVRAARLAGAFGTWHGRKVRQ